MPKYVMVVLSNPTAGKEEEYNRWYDETHLPQVLTVPGFVAAQRFRCVQGMGRPVPAQYLALYEVETDAPSAALADLSAFVADGRIAMSDAIDDATIVAALFEPIAERLAE